MQAPLRSRSQRHREERISGTACSIASSMVLCALLTMFPDAAETRNNTCQSKVCKAVAEVLDRTVNQSVKPCDDFYTHVCAGWMDTVRKKLSNVTGKVRRLATTVGEEKIFPALLLRELKRRLPKVLAANSSTEHIRDSEMQPVLFFKSCLRSNRENNWDFNTRTLRKFFHEVDLPFFDEKPFIQNNCTHRTPLTSLLKLALKFGISPVFLLEFSQTRISVWKTSFRSYEQAGTKEESKVIAKRWRKLLLYKTRGTVDESKVVTEFGAVFEAFHIRVSTEDLLEWGRNYQAVQICYETVFKQLGGDRTSDRLNKWSKYVNSTYFDLLDQNTGNIAQFNEDQQIAFTTHFFEPLLILTTDPSLFHIFTDYIRLYLLRYELSAPIGKTACGLLGENCTRSEEDTLRYCGRLVSGSPLRKQAPN